MNQDIDTILKQEKSEGAMPPPPWSNYSNTSASQFVYLPIRFCVVEDIVLVGGGGLLQNISDMFYV